MADTGSRFANYLGSTEKNRMAATRVIPLAINPANQTLKNFLANSDISVGDALEMASDGTVKRADQTSAGTVVGIATQTASAGSLQTISVQATGNVVQGSWNFTNIGQPVFVDPSTPGNLTQNIGTVTEGYLKQVGTAFGGNQVALGIVAPVLVSISATSTLALSSKGIVNALAGYAALDPVGTAANGVGQLAVFTSAGAIAKAGGLILPSVGGTILTDNSLIAAGDYD
jgi:hypothetical protein